MAFISTMLVCPRGVHSRRRRRHHHHQRETNLIFYQIVSSNSLSKCFENSLENVYVDIGA